MNILSPQVEAYYKKLFMVHGINLLNIDVRCNPMVANGNFVKFDLEGFGDVEIGFNDLTLNTIDNRVVKFCCMISRVELEAAKKFGEGLRHFIEK